jgi:hypothetical protein
MESDFTGDLDLNGFLGLKEDVRPGYQRIRATFRLPVFATEVTRNWGALCTLNSAAISHDSDLGAKCRQTSRSMIHVIDCC